MSPRPSRPPLPSTFLPPPPSASLASGRSLHAFYDGPRLLAGSSPASPEAGPAGGCSAPRPRRRPRGPRGPRSGAAPKPTGPSATRRWLPAPAPRTPRLSRPMGLQPAIPGTQPRAPPPVPGLPLLQASPPPSHPPAGDPSALHPPFPQPALSWAHLSSAACPGLVGGVDEVHTPASITFSSKVWSVCPSLPTQPSSSASCSPLLFEDTALEKPRGHHMLSPWAPVWSPLSTAGLPDA